MISSDIRTVSAEEVAHLRDHGWVKLDQLISPELTRTLLERAKGRLGPHGVDHVRRPGIDLDTPHWADYHDIVQEDESFSWLGLNPQMGVNAQRLIRRNRGMLMWSNLLAVKIGAKQGASANEPTCFHQDGPDLPFDRESWVRFWIALDHLTVDMGPVRFIDSSHRLGSLGCSYLEYHGQPEDALFDEYPALKEMSVSQPLEFHPGDATAHSMYTVHGSLGNDTDRPRWALVLTYFADDTIYTGNAICAPSNLLKIKKAGMTPGDRFDETLYPRVCTAS
jgi:hypothetical protein